MSEKRSTIVFFGLLTMAVVLAACGGNNYEG